MTPNNVFRGITPTFTVFTTDPSNASYATDGSWGATLTGYGSKVMSGAGVFGEILFDLGTTKTFILGGYVGAYSTAGSVLLYAQYSNDNVTFVGNNQNAQPLTKVTSTTAANPFLNTIIMTGRYIKLICYVDAASTPYLRMNEIVGYELGGA
jgi:hypothetical protein